MTTRGWTALAAAVLLAAAATGCAAPTTPSGSSTTGASVATSVLETSARDTSPSGTESGGPAPGVSAAPTEQNLPERTAAALPDCSPGALATATPGSLVVATGRDPRPPWFTTADPATADGYEAQIARRVAAILGYPADRVTWTSVDTAAALGGNTAGFDMLIDNIRETPEAAALVDFSSGYYSITDAVLMPRSALPPAGPPDVGALRLGVIEGGTGTLSLDERGLTAAEQFDTPAAAAAAVAAASSPSTSSVSTGVQAVVLPTPDAIDAARSDPGLAVAGQVEPGRWQPDQFHLVLAKDSPLTPCVSAAVDRLRIEGALDTLTRTFITGPLAPMLTF